MAGLWSQSFRIPISQQPRGCSLLTPSAIWELWEEKRMGHQGHTLLPPTSGRPQTARRPGEDHLCSQHRDLARGGQKGEPGGKFNPSPPLLLSWMSVNAHHKLPLS